MEVYIKQLEQLLDLYKDDEYMLQRIDTYIMKILPNSLEQSKKNHIERINRKDKLLLEEDLFIERFHSKNHYSYCSNLDLFINYDNKHFSLHNEDSILHEILSSITYEENLMPWKQKVKLTIMKLIRSKSPLHETPDTFTIQFVLESLINDFFIDKNSAKHFLTSVGDYILGKQRSLIYIYQSNIRELINEIEYSYNEYFGNSNILSGYKQKYYEHDYSKCRFLNSIITDKPIKVKTNITKYILDLLCVATHYSNRYENADNFINQNADLSLKNHIFYLVDKSPSIVVDEFIQTSITSSKQGLNIKNKSMTFIWKKFLDNKNIPNVIFYDKLNELFKEKLNYNNENDCYTDVISKYLPEVIRFNNFWDEYIDIDENSYELEIDEIILLFNKQLKNRYNYSISDGLVNEIINYFYNYATIVSNKYVYGIKCKLWDKFQDIETFIEILKTSGDTYCSIFQLYNKYLDSDTQYKMSKQCFEKICSDIFGEKINQNGDIDMTFWN